MGTIELMLSVLLVILIGLLIFFVAMLMKNYMKEKMPETKKTGSKSEEDAQSQKQINAKKSVLSFLDFEKIEDSMIITKKGRKYIMVIECQGVNYDLMSELEKNGVEVGFLEFLNALRHPIQIYLQTRTINLGKSLMNYKDRLDKYEMDYRQAEREYVQIANDRNATDKEILDAKLEYNRRKNIYDYSRDVIQNTEKISQNKNVLTRKYYIVISQYVAENKDEKSDLEEKVEEVFQELYTKAQSIIRSLSSCSIQSKILNSEELVELMYIAYNRDEYDTYGMDKAIQAGYDELYSTGEDAFAKRVKLLDKMIEEKAVEKINRLADIARTEQEREVKDREKNINLYINAMARTVLDKNKTTLGEEISERVSEKLDKEDKKRELKAKEGAKNVTKKEAIRRKRG